MDILQISEGKVHTTPKGFLVFLIPREHKINILCCYGCLTIFHKTDFANKKLPNFNFLNQQSLFQKTYE